MSKLINLLAILMVIASSCTSTPEQQNEKIVKYFLHPKDIVERFGEQSRAGTLHSGTAIAWETELVQTDKYDVYISGNAQSSIEDLELSISFGEDTHTFAMPNTKGPFSERKIARKANHECKKVLSGVSIPAGLTKITLSAPEIDTDEELLYICSVELIPHSSLEAIKNEAQRAAAARGDMKWMNDAKYGIMLHWTSQSVNADGNQVPFEQAVNEFDIPKFVEMVEGTGAGYVIFTIGHAEQFCPAPIKSWETIHPGQTTERDLVMEIADALADIDVKLLCYMHSQRTAKIGEGTNEEFFARFTSILNEFGERYGEKVAGYWFDCWYQIYIKYMDVDFEEFFKATKVGNKDRVMCLNSWIYPIVTPWQDYWAGEVCTYIAPPKNGTYTDGPAVGLPHQVLLTMEKDNWVQEEKQIADPSFGADDLAQYIKDCSDNGGVVTINLSIYQNGDIGEKAKEVMAGVKSQIR